MAANAAKSIRYWWQTKTGDVPSKWDRVWDDANGTFTDITTNANSAATADVTITGTASTSRIYFGMTSFTFDFIRLIFSTTPTVGTRTWEYWNGTAWTSISGIAAQTGSLNFTGGGTHEIKWTPPSDWATTSINSVTCYYVRATVGTGYTVTGVGSFFLPGVVNHFAQITIAVPETTSRTVTSAMLKFHFNRALQGKNIFMTQTRCASKLGSNTLTYTHDGAVDWTSNNGNPTYPSSSIVIDATSYFVSNLGTGTTQTLDLYLSMCSEIVGTTLAGATPVQGLTAELILTYQYDATSQDTRVKTVIIPIESQNSGALTTSLVEMGTNQIPALDTFLPESTKSYKNIMMVLTGSDYQSAVGNRILSYALDAASATAIMSCDTATSVSADPDTFAVDLSAMTTNAVHAFKLKTSSTSIGPYSNIAMYLVVTYTYSHTSSTSFINSVQVPLGLNSEFANASGNPSASRLPIVVEEPATIALVQSGVMVRWNIDSSQGASTVIIKFGSQTARTYTPTSISGGAGDDAITHRIDSGGAQGAGMTLARGVNYLDFHMYSGANLAVTASAVLFLNYTSGKAGGGDNTHNHTILDLIRPLPTTTWAITNTVTANITPSIIETNYWINCFGFALFIMMADYGSQGLHTFIIAARRATGEGPGDGFVQVAVMADNKTLSDSPYFEGYAQATKEFMRWPADWNAVNLMSPVTARKYLLQDPATNAGFNPQVMTMLTYHSITFSVSGTVSGYTGDGSGITVYAHRNDTGERMGSATTAAGGGFTITVPTSDASYFAQAQQDGTHLGCSVLGTPT